MSEDEDLRDDEMDVLAAMFSADELSISDVAPCVLPTICFSCVDWSHANHELKCKTGYYYVHVVEVRTGLRN